jgi:hypothetical protein
MGHDKQRADFQPYNSNAPIDHSEYGRNIQRMVEYALTLEDKEERNKCTRAILSVMYNCFPLYIEDFNHKLWTIYHVHFSLDVDSPYPRPDKEHLVSKPEPMPYPHNDIRFGHYGHYVESMIAKCSAMEEGEEKNAFALSIANLMKFNAINWNRNVVHDDVILKDLAALSKGNIRLEHVTTTSETTDHRRIQRVRCGSFQQEQKQTQVQQEQQQ